MGKGEDHERLLCGQWSTWWTEGLRDDCFWRAQGSGGRATSRGKKGKTTEGQCGDIAATHPLGKPFTDFITIEMKRGYTKEPIIDFCDRPQRGATTGRQRWDHFFEQTIKAHNMAGTYAWLIVSRRDFRPAWVYMPRYLARGLRGVGAMVAPPRPYMSFVADYRINPRAAGTWLHVHGVTLDYWFSQVKPCHIKRLAKQWATGN